MYAFLAFCISANISLAPSDGILFDVVECLVQRTFGYATSDVRLCYKIVKEKLYDPQFSKVILILHSQGGIEGGMVLDWLLQELPQDLLAKLEVCFPVTLCVHQDAPALGT